MRSGYGLCNTRDMPWAAKDHESFLDEVESHLSMVDLEDATDRDMLVSLLYYREADGPGRCFGKHRVGIHRYPLRYNDRLVAPTDNMVYITVLEQLVCPETVVFSRPRKESQITATSVLFDLPGEPLAGRSPPQRAVMV